MVFQLEAGFALLRLLAVDESEDDRTWHVAAYRDFFPDVDSAERAVLRGDALDVASPHMAVTTRAFRSTQVARIANRPLTSEETAALDRWRRDPKRRVSDRSVRLLLGFR